MQSLLQRAVNFLFPGVADRWLTVLRCGLGFQLTLYCVSSWSDWQLLYSSSGNGLISRDLAEAILSVESALVPRLGWVVTAGEQLGLSEPVILQLTWLFLLCAGLCLLFGAFSRTAAIVAWFLYLCAVKSGVLTSYGMDNFTIIGLFYLMVAPLPDRFSFDVIVRKLPVRDERLHGFHCRVLQIHLCLIYFFGGLTKALGPAWWNGESMWRALTRSPFNVISPDFLASWGSALPLLGIGVCFLETGYPFFIWSRRTRAIWLAGILVMHVAIGLTMGLYLFGLIMIILNLAAFGPDLRTRVVATAEPLIVQVGSKNLIRSTPDR